MRQVYPPTMLRGATAIAKFIAVIALLIGAGAASLFSGVLPAQAQTPTITDYDTNDNGLIEVSDPAQLNAMRWDLNAGAVRVAVWPTHCDTEAAMGEQLERMAGALLR